jgi:uncharacterized membrane protein YgdD (TMEM256/DUF423 family)
MVYIMDNMAGAAQYFMLSFLMTFVIGGLMGSAGVVWPLYFGLSIVILHAQFPDFDWGMTNTLSKFLAAKFGQDGITLDEMLTKVAIQFLGVFVASLIWLEIGADELAMGNGSQWQVYHVPVLSTVYVTDVETKKFEIFAHWMIWHMVQLYIFNKLKTQRQGLEANMQTAMAYLLSVTLMNATYKNSIGGFTFDAGRWLAGIIKFDDDTYQMHGTWWILLFAPFAGYALCLGWNFLESLMNKKAAGGDSGAAAPATEEAAEENA